MDGLRYGLKCLRTSCEAGCTRPDRQELPLPRQSRLDLPPQIGQFKTGKWLPLWVALTTFERTHSGSD